MNSPCTVIQERIVAGETLGEGEQAHVLDCEPCSRFAADCLVLDSLVADGMNAAVAVPDDFADRVMDKLDVAGANRWHELFGRRWIQIAAANVGIAFAVINLIRFVLAALVPTTSLGALP
jgi:hypothetical protein